MHCWTRLVTLLVLASTCWGEEWTTHLTARYYSLTHKFHSFDARVLQDDNSNRTHKYIYIKAGTTEKAPLVQAKLSSSDVFDSCDEDIIRVYSGESEEEGLYMGSFCSGVYDEIYQASDNAMFLVIEVARMPPYFILTIEYFTVSECRVALYVRSSPRYLRSPSFRDKSHSGSTDIYSCRWTLSSSKSKRIRVSLRFPPGYSPDCSKNVSLSESETDSFLTGRVFANWCGGLDHTFVSFYSNVLASFNTRFRDSSSFFGLPPVEMKFQAVEEDTCYQELVVKEGEGGTIYSPWYPNPINPGKVCKWKLTTQSLYSQVLRINVTETNLADTPGCTKDIVRVYDVRSHNSPVTEWWCGSATPVFELYTSSLVVELRTGFNHSGIYRGFTIQYLSALEPLCSYSLTASSARQSITSPGFPNPFRSYMKCKWRITSTSPQQVIKLDVIKSDLEKIPRPSCSRSKLMVYEGVNEEAKLLKSWCQDEQMSLQSRGQNLLVVFLAENNHLDARDGFSMDFYEGQYEDRVEVSMVERAITFPANSFYYVEGYDAKWYLYTKQSVHHVAIRFTEVYLNCPSDIITITDGDLGDTPRIFTFCGGSDRSHFSSSSAVSVGFTTRTNKGRGFTMTYKLVYYPGCFRKVQEVNAEMGDSYLTSPGLTYYDNMDCSWRFIAKDPSQRLKMHIEVYNIITYSGDRCPTDFLRVYNGHDTASQKVSPSWMCGINKEWTIHSSSRYMYVEFHSDNFKTDRGFKITYSTYLPASTSESKTDSFPTAVVTGVVISLILLIALCTLIFLCRRSRRNHRRSNPPEPPENISSIRYTLPPAPSAPPPPVPSVHTPPALIPAEPPPSYDEIERLDPGAKDDEALPPSYIEAVREGMVSYTPHEPLQHGYF